MLSHPSEVDKSSSDGDSTRGRIVCITSGKGGVDKTTPAALFATGLALRGLKTCVVDFDIGLRLVGDAGCLMVDAKRQPRRNRKRSTPRHILL